MEHEQRGGAADIGQVINRQIETKISYLKDLKTAVANHSDAEIYRLLDSQRYAKEIEHRESQPNDKTVVNLVNDVADQLSNYLSRNLIDYLGHVYPFFYYEEYQTGHFRIYFGNWWDRREFGELDVINIRFAFNSDEFDKLKRSFELSRDHKRINSARIDKLSAENDHLQDLLDHSEEREQEMSKISSQLSDMNAHSGIWESSRNKETRENLTKQLQKLENEQEESRHAAKIIKANDEDVLQLSKENTIMSYEMKSIVDSFGSFDDFQLANRNLYADYLKHLTKDGSEVSDNE